MTSSNGNIFRVTGPLCGEFTGPGEFHTQRPVTQSFWFFFDLRLNKRLSKQPWGWWFETPSWSLWRQCNECDLLIFMIQDCNHDCFSDGNVTLQNKDDKLRTNTNRELCAAIIGCTVNWKLTHCSTGTYVGSYKRVLINCNYLASHLPLIYINIITGANILAWYKLCFYQRICEYNLYISHLLRNFHLSFNSLWPSDAIKCPVFLTFSMYSTLGLSVVLNLYCNWFHGSFSISGSSNMGRL